MKKIICLCLLLCSGSVLADSVQVIQDKIQTLKDQMAQPFACSCASQQASIQQMESRQLAVLQAQLAKAQASPSPSPSGVQ